MRYFSYAMIFLSASLLIACGQKGDLYLPEDTGKKQQEDVRVSSATDKKDVSSDPLLDQTSK